MLPERKKDESIVIRKPEVEDGILIYDLVSRCPPLDLNSVYSYLLISAHFQETSAVAEFNGKLVGYCSAYIPPKKIDTLFIWQVAVKENARGLGIALSMIQRILARKDLSEISFIETTISPDNHPSLSLFTRLASDLDAEINKKSFFSMDLFGESNHPPEYLYQIGPINSILN